MRLTQGLGLGLATEQESLESEKSDFTSLFSVSGTAAVNKIN